MLGDKIQEIHTNSRSMRVPVVHRRRDAMLVLGQLKSLQSAVDSSSHRGYRARNAGKDGHSPNSG